MDDTRAKRIRGLSFVEYAIMMIAIILMAAGLRPYLQAVIQGRLEEARVTILDQAAPFDPTSVADASAEHRLEVTDDTSAVPVAAAFNNPVDPFDDAAARDTVVTTSATSLEEHTKAVRNAQ